MFGGINDETNPYELIEKKDGYEIRRYRKQYLAQVKYDTSKDLDFSATSGKKFSSLFNYIYGKNETNTKILMTAPVIMQATENGDRLTRTMSFIMSPSKFTSLDQVPAAIDRDILIVEQANAQDMACITFNMTMTTERNLEKENELRQAASRDGLKLSPHKSDVQYFAYNSPFTIPYFKRNEICIPIIGEWEAILHSDANVLYTSFLSNKRVLHRIDRKSWPARWSVSRINCVNVSSISHRSQRSV